MKYSLCQQNFETINILYTHLRYAHLITQNTYIDCGEENCPSSYSSIKAFKLHIIKRHRNLEKFTARPFTSADTQNFNDNWEHST